MWQLQADQAAALSALKRQRDLARVGEALGQAFPAIRERVGARFPELLELGTAKAEPHGLTHALAVARYLACWFMAGAEFEARPGNEWARAILGAPGRSEGAKVFQLCRRVGEGLGAGRAAFEASLAQLDRVLQRQGAVGDFFDHTPLVLGSACDIDAIDLRLLDAPSFQRYALASGGWQREPNRGDRAPITVTDETGAAALPSAVHLLGSETAPGRLRVRTKADHRCDAQVHARLVFQSAQTVHEVRGEQAGELLLTLPPAVVDEAAPLTAFQPLIGAETAQQISLLTFDACGLREDGVPLVSGQGLTLPISVWPATQHLLSWQRAPAPPLSWPEAATQAPVLPSGRVTLERDGQPLDAARWQAGLDALDQQWLAALGRLATAWEREAGVTGGRLAAEPRVMCGSAEVTWGWAEGAQGLATAPFFRTAGRIELIACRLDLRFSGTLVLQGSHSRLQLHCAAGESLVMQWDRGSADVDPAALLTPAAISFQQPFVLAVESHVHADLAMLSAGPAQGVIVGACGLRPRPEGSGLQWFCTLTLEPVTALLRLHDPVLGVQELPRTLLPGMTLVDWSLG